MRSIRLLITEKCNANCKNCFNKNYRNSKDMDFMLYCKLLSYLSKHGFDKIKIMGGEPTVHPCFSNMINKAQQYFDSVIIFSNALNDKIFDVELREKDSIVYNAQFINENFDIDKLLINQNGTRIQEVQIYSDMDTNGFINNIDNMLTRAESKYGHKVLSEKISFNLTLNCSENIFLNRNVLIRKWNKIYNYIKSKRYDIAIDHSIPLCFFVNTDMKIKQSVWKCTPKCAGLIDTDLNLRYCNQQPKVLLHIYEDNRFVPIGKIDNYLHMEYLNKTFNNMDKICKDCPFFNKKCNGGCFIHKDYITKEDIIFNTNLPTK